MAPKQTRVAFVGTLLLALSVGGTAAATPDPLPSWRDGDAKRAITTFVAAVTTKGSPDFVEPADRVAAFDNDGTLWSEQPMYVQLAFALDRVKTMAPDHPEWKDTEPFKSVLANDIKGIAASGQKGVAEIVAATHAGMTTAEFEKIVAGWIATARNPKTGKLDDAMIFQPMLELINYLKANGFDVFIVSGGGVEFMRPWTERTYGIPAENVIGSSVKMKYQSDAKDPAIVRLPEIDFVDDGAGKPLGIQKFIGERPIAAFGNSDGDFEMLEWTTTGPGRRLGMIVHHDDAKREFAYDRVSEFGRLDRALDAAPQRGWNVISMKDDWRTVFPNKEGQSAPRQ
jgi:hypothetical protein